MTRRGCLQQGRTLTTRGRPLPSAEVCQLKLSVAAVKVSNIGIRFHNNWKSLPLIFKDCAIVNVLSPIAQKLPHTSIYGIKSHSNNCILHL